MKTTKKLLLGASALAMLTSYSGAFAAAVSITTADTATKTMSAGDTLTVSTTGTDLGSLIVSDNPAVTVSGAAGSITVQAFTADASTPVDPTKDKGVIRTKAAANPAISIAAGGSLDLIDVIGRIDSTSNGKVIDVAGTGIKKIWVHSDGLINSSGAGNADNAVIDIAVAASASFAGGDLAAFQAAFPAPVVASAGTVIKNEGAITRTGAAGKAIKVAGSGTVYIENARTSAGDALSVNTPTTDHAIYITGTAHAFVNNKASNTIKGLIHTESAGTAPTLALFNAGTIANDITGVAGAQIEIKNLATGTIQGAIGADIATGAVSVTNSGTISGAIGNIALTNTATTDAIARDVASAEYNAVNNALTANSFLTLAAAQALVVSGAGKAAIASATTAADVVTALNTLSGTATASASASAALVNGAVSVTNSGTISGNIGLGSASASSVTLSTPAATDIAAINGVISGLGSVTKTGPGTATLSGTNTYTGQTIIGQPLTNAPYGGTLAISKEANLGTTPSTFEADQLLFEATGGTLQATDNLTISANRGITLTGHGTFKVNMGKTLTIASAITGATKDLTKEGDGELNLTNPDTLNPNDYRNTIVNHGTLRISSSGAIPVGSTLTINAPGQVALGTGITKLVINGASGAAVLAGNGKVVGNVVNQGFVRPGTVDSSGAHAAGTLEVTGDYTHGNMLYINLNPDGTSDALKVGGTANLSGTLDLTFAAGAYQPVTSYPILTAANIQGTFSSFNPNQIPAGMGWSISYDTPGKVIIELIDAQFKLSRESTAYTSLASSAVQSSHLLNNSILDHLTHAHHNTRTGMSSGEEVMAMHSASKGFKKQGVWAKVLGAWSKASSDNANIADFDANSEGVVAGIDLPIDERGVLGAAFSYDYTNLNESDLTRNQGSINTPRLTLYGGTDFNGFAIDAMVGYGLSNIKATKKQTAPEIKTSYKGQDVSAALQASHAVGAVMFKVGGLYASLNQYGFNVNNISSIPVPTTVMKVNSKRTNSFQPFVGISLARTFAGGDSAATPELGITYRREVLSNERILDAQSSGSFVITGISPSKDILGIKAGISAKVKEKMGMFLHYNADLSKNVKSHSLSAGVKCTF